jgi:hypothetical protein
MTRRPSKPIDPAEYALTATPTPRTFEPTRFAPAHAALPFEQIGAFVPRPGKALVA